MHLPDLLDHRAAISPDAAAIADDRASLSNRDATLTETDIESHVQRSLSKYKWPVDTIFVDEGPKNPVGKIDKPSLRRRLVAPAVST